MTITRVQLVGNVSTGASFSGIVTATAANIGGGAIDINSTGINATGVSTFTSVRATNINATGIITATSFSGSGSLLTGLVAGVGIKTAGGTVGTGATFLDFRGSGISTVTVGTGIATVNVSGGGNAFSAVGYVFNL